MFANKTFANRTFANGESLGDILAKVQWTFTNWRNSRGCIGESTIDFANYHETILIWDICQSKGNLFRICIS